MTASRTLELLSPLSGRLVPIEAVPDPVFAQKMVGDGISIEPSSYELLAPTAGTVMHVHRAGHAATLRTPHGVEILLHIGIETVHLGGEGFVSWVRPGDVVRAGDVLISFDAARVATRATSLLTQLVVTGGGVLVSRGSGTAVAGRSVALVVEVASSQARAQGEVFAPVTVQAWLEADAPDVETEGWVFANLEGALASKSPSGRAVSVRVDSPLPGVREANPLLGMKGTRALLEEPGVLVERLGPVLARWPGARLLFSMLGSVDELRAARDLVRKAAGGQPAVPSSGLLLETPASALLAAEFARECDYLCVDLPELAQYVLATDRAHPSLGGRADPLHPGVLRFVQLAVSGARQAGRRIGACTGTPWDSSLVPVLLGLGIDDLLVPPHAVAAARALVAGLDRAACRVVAQEALRLGTAEEVRARRV